MGLGKNRAPLGEWLDSKGIKQEWLIKKSKVGKNTISKSCSDSEYIPSGSTMKKILKALRDVEPSVRADQFWEM